MAADIEMRTQFNGGFVVDGPRCAQLEVHVLGGGLAAALSLRARDRGE